MAIWLLSACFCVADLPSPRLDRLRPLGAAAGSTVEAEVAGAELDDAKSLLFDHPGLTAEFVKDRKFKITVAADVPAGTYDVRVVGRFGITNPRLFAVSHGLKDSTEKEPNNDSETAQPVEINSAIYGDSDGNGEDLFSFTVKQGKRVTIECQAGMLDSALDANLTLTTADGKLLASNGDYRGRDPFLDFVAPADGEYVVKINDLSFRGGFPYRLVITDKPQVENIFPRAVQAGKPVQLKAFGRNFGSGSAKSRWSLNDLPLDEFVFSLTPPDDVLKLGAYRFLDHPTDHTVLPTAATCTVTGFQIRPVTGGGSSLNAASLIVTDIAPLLESEPNDTSEKPQPIALPAVVNGRFDRPRDSDWFEFEATEGGQYEFDVYCERIAGRADPYLVVLDDKGNRLTELDDFGHRMNAFDGHLRDPVGMIGLSAKRKYRVLVQDRYSRGGARFQYVLSIRKPVPDFYVAAIHSQNPGPGAANVRKGGATYVDVVIHQRGGYNGPVTITADKLPPGLHVAPTTLTNSTRGTLTLWADENAPDWAGTIELTATGVRDGKPFRREVRPYTRVWNNAGMGSSRPTRKLAVAIREQSPFSLQFAAENVTVEAGKSAELKLQLKRYWPDFKGKVTLLPLSFSGGFKMQNGTIAAAANEGTVSIQVQANMRPGKYTLSVTGQVQAPFNKDPNAKERPNTLVSLPSRPVTLTVVAAAK